MFFRHDAGQSVFRLAQSEALRRGAGESLELFLEHFPTVMRDDALEFLKPAREDDPAR